VLPAGTACPALQQLYVAANRLSSLPASLAATPLADVFASENCFPQLPPVLLQLGQVQKLSLAACELRELPEDLTGLSELRWGQGWCGMSASACAAAQSALVPGAVACLEVWDARHVACHVRDAWLHVWHGAMRSCFTAIW
jgi:hypothetical protein